MRYPEQPLTENEEGERGRKEERVRGMNLYREETKGEVERRRTAARIYVYATPRVPVYERGRER